MTARRRETFRALGVTAVFAAAGLAACTAGRGGEGGADGSECRVGVLEVSGADPFPELALVDSAGARTGIAWDATELPALSGATVELCVTRSPVEARDDIVRFDLVSVDGMPAVLGRVSTAPAPDASPDEDLEVAMTRAATGQTFRVRTSEPTAAELVGRCAWIAGEIDGEVLQLTSYGLAPDGVCDLADPSGG